LACIAKTDKQLEASRPLWLPMYHSLPPASTIILRMPVFFEGSGGSRIILPS